MVANGGKSRSLAQAMRDAGYSESYARNPQKIKQTRAWREYLEEAMPDETLASIHLNLLKSYKIGKLLVSRKLSDKEITLLFGRVGYKVVSIERKGASAKATFVKPDNSARISALDLAYKIKGKYKQQVVVYNKYQNLSDTELDKIISSFGVKNGARRHHRVVLKKS